MKKDKLLNLFNEFDFKMFIKNNMTSYKIRKAISEKVSESDCPSTTAITNYIKKKFNLQWDTKTHSWNTYKSNTNITSKSKKKVSPKDTNTLTINHENKLSDESCIYNSPKLKPNQLSLDLTNTESNSNISNLKTVNNDTLKCNNSNTTRLSNKAYFNDNINYDVSQCYEYIAASENMKISISINCELFEIIKKLLCEKYNIKRKGNRSKIIHLALMECLKFNKSQ
ncbi:hypothetical protein Z968_06530 [Clostridium novyi A str. 4552]|uniref:Uncharacterized protein n=1 Tax=Clostridium novyi A str. 4552 TaxID=1444289 RepID=A0A0A0I7V4_CLONO|nr:hypothetical protein [Clostridium novyi]KGM96371.1 hypothetical protein Z968_06530 [Clostridium novyi A str. 4552]